MPIKIVINVKHGGFNLSDEAIDEYVKRSGTDYDNAVCNLGFMRDDPILVSIVEEMKEKASGNRSRLVVIEIPDNVEWQIEDYDGLEHVAEKHRTWRYRGRMFT